MKLLQGLGAAGGPVSALMFYLWHHERTERREAVAKLLEHATTAVNAMRDNTAAINALASKIASR